MRVEKERIADKVYLLRFQSQFDVASTFLRFQEHYESPKFKGKVFTLKEFKDWRRKTTGRFRYYKEWSGFNIPSRVLKPFYAGRFDPLSQKEKKLLSLFKGERGSFYIIATYHNSVPSTLEHEMAHALFYTQPEYRKQVLSTLSKFDLADIRKELHAKGGYCRAVLEDELHAWVLSLSHEIKSKIPKGLKPQLRKLFRRYANYFQ